MVIVCPLVYIWGFYICMHTTMTICKTCNTNKEDTKENWYYYNGKRHWLKCKECMLKGRKSEHELGLARERDRKRYQNNPERRKYLFESGRKRRKEKWYNPIHLKTERRIVKLWVRPKTCPICWRESRIISHHPDYSKPFEIIFCCQICHDKIHRWKIKCPEHINLKSFIM